MLQTAEEREIKRRISARHEISSDRNQGDKEAEAKFKEIKEAYEALTDAQKRAAYDQYGHAAFEQGGMAADLAAALMAALISVIFLRRFWRYLMAGVVANVRRVGLIWCYKYGSYPEEAVRGVTKEIRIPTLEECDVCHGSGVESWYATAKPVRTCHALWSGTDAPKFFCCTADLPTLGQDAVR